jgi:hypothetical protein
MLAAQQATTTIPIVMAYNGKAVASVGLQGELKMRYYYRPDVHSGTVAARAAHKC